MFSEVITPRFCDTDALGHINNTMLPIWFEGAREPVFKLFMPALNLKEWRLILAKIDVNFHAQIFYGKAVELRTYIGRIGSSSFDVYQELWQNDTKCASGTAVMVHFCYENQSASKIPSDVQFEMEKHLYSVES
ncbi:MAG: thioesterase family protein [Cognaticolwellia sp.]|jgi:acyl-CoA thioester hydrolase